MAAEEDKKFDAVVGGFLVNDLRARSESLQCPGPDVLAAYHERSLLPEEMNSWKEHIVGCANCQAILAEVEATDSIPLQAAEEEKILVMQPAVAAAAAPATDRIAGVASSDKSRAARVSRGVRWYWLAPAGALAASLLVWVAWHEKQRPTFPNGSEDKVARVAPAASPPLSTNAKSAATSSSDEIALLHKDSGELREAARAKRLPPPENLKQQDKHDSFAKAARPPQLPDQVAGLPEAGRARSEPDSLTAANRGQDQRALDAKGGVAGAVAESVEVQTQAANNQLQNQQNQSNAQSVHGPMAAQSKKEKSAASAHAYNPAPAAPVKPSEEVAFDKVRASRGLIAGPLNWHSISAPGGKTLWRAGPTGLILFSNDGGATWASQTTNVTVDLTSGSAPSEKVCWIVGRAGTILLTTDSGAHWTAVRSPLEEDLAGVRATDTLHATIWSSVGPASFSTADSGVTWKSIPPQ